MGASELFTAYVPLPLCTWSTPVIYVETAKNAENRKDLWFVACLAAVWGIGLFDFVSEWLLKTQMLPSAVALKWNSGTAWIPNDKLALSAAMTSCRPASREYPTEPFLDFFGVVFSQSARATDESFTSFSVIIP